MKLAEALLERADCKKRLGQLERRIIANAVVQEGDEPSEDPKELMEQYIQILGRVERLIEVINQANVQATLPSGMTLSRALARRESLRQENSVLTRLAETGNPNRDRYSHSEIRSVSTIDVKEIQKKADQRGKECRELDAEIQKLNWSYDVEV